MTRAIIFDCDGTLFDVRHRLHFLQGEVKDWEGFHNAIPGDTPIKPVLWLAKTLHRATQGATKVDCDGKPFAVLVVTARHRTYERLTWAQFETEGFFPHRYYMRADDDHRPDHEVKADILDQILADGFEPWLVVDDRPEVCDMWRSFGITVLQCEYTDLAGKHSGKVMLTELIGPAGAGKSTLAAKLYRPSEIICPDVIREQEGLTHHPDDLYQTFKLARGLAKARIDAGFRAVIDATNLRQKDRLAFARLVPRGALIEYVLVDRDYDDKVANRGWRPVELIDKHHRMFRDKTLPDIRTTDGLGNVIVIDKRTKR